MNVTLISHWGDDLEVVNNARVSFGKKSEWVETPDGQKVLSTVDTRLIGYLARGTTQADYDQLIAEVLDTGEAEDVIELLRKHRQTPTHWVPFANGIGAKFHVKAPFPNMRQLFKHKVGAVESEVSRRYVSDTPNVFLPTFRIKAPNVKQGSGQEFEDQTEVQSIYLDSVTKAVASYEALLAAGVCEEQARYVLPQGAETEAIISHSLYGWANLYKQRHDRSHTQGETADLADAISAELHKLFPVSWPALINN